MGNVLRSIGSFFDDQVKRAQYGPNYKQRARYLTLLQDQKMKEGEEDLKYKQELRKTQIINRAKALMPLLTGAAYGSAEDKSTPVPGQTPMPTPMGAGPGGGGGYQVNLPPQTEVTSQIGDFDTSMIDHDPELAPFKNTMVAGARGEALKVKDLQRDDMMRAATGRLSAENSGRNVNSMIGRREAQTADMDATRAGRISRLLYRPPPGQGPRDPNNDPRNYIVSTDSNTGEAVRIRKTDGAIFPLEGVRNSSMTIGEREGRASIEGILDDIESIGATVRRNPGAVGLRSGVENWIGQYTGGVEPDIVDVHTKVAEGLVTQLHALSGAAVTKQEADRLEKILPSPTLHPDVFLQRLQLWNEDLKQAHRAFLIGKGKGRVGGGDNPLHPKTPRDTPPSGTTDGLDPSVLDRLNKY